MAPGRADPARVPGKASPHSGTHDTGNRIVVRRVGPWGQMAGFFQGTSGGDPL